MPDLNDATTRERVAQAIHEGYLAACTARGETAATNGALVPWEELPERLRAANRDQAADIAAKLQVIGAAVAPLTAAAPDFAFTDEEVERLAPLEHDRWMSERTRSGFEYGPVRDATHHPDLVGWDELDQPTRDKDRQAVREIPAVLSAAGLRVVRR